MKIAGILAKVTTGNMTLPAFQRGYVWKRRQVRELFDSLYRRHPVGSLLTWITSLERGGSTELLLDGQQRVTSLYGVIKGEVPRFFEGDVGSFSDLYFHAGEERFEFFQSIKMKEDPLWFDVTRVMKAGVDGLADLLAERLVAAGETLDPLDFITINNRLLHLLGVTGIDLHIEQLTDEGHSVDTVLGIFNRLNSAGTKLSSGDLALARIAVKWPQVGGEMRSCLKALRIHYGFSFTKDWLLRCVNAVASGEAGFQRLHEASRGEVKASLERTLHHLHRCLDHIHHRLRLDHDRVLFGRLAFPVMVRHLELSRPGPGGQWDWDSLLYWFLQAGMRGRFSASAETAIKQDLASVDGTMDGIERLIGDIGTRWGRRQVEPADFDSWSIGARLYPPLYWLARAGGARDFCSGIDLRAVMPGGDAQLRVHPIFPKGALYAAGYSRSQVNALANLCFLAPGCNEWMDAACPAEPSPYVEDTNDPVRRRIGREGYFPFVREQHPGVLESQWIPMDEKLWKVDNFLPFLKARRTLLARAANRHLSSLYPRHAKSVVEP
ncbi:MAG: DUF262 domain-containing protein [Gammaproteobacteria bacterium]|nr:DUF262 domain-containing protein [Gammaproteobacteria bacterium]